MKFRRRIIAVGFIAFGLLVGCDKRQPMAVSRTPRNKGEAGVVVTNLARARRIQLDRYKEPSVRFEEKRREWHFDYEMKPPGMPGGHFSIIVNEDGTVQHIGGS